MAVYQEIIDQIDKGISPEFAASLAGLSLAAAAFFSPGATKTLEDAKARLNELDPKIDMAVDKGITGETAFTKEREKVNKIIAATMAAQDGLIKSFLVFTWFLVYTISLDQIIDTDFFEKTLLVNEDFPTHLFTTSDALISILLFSVAGKNLWKGAIGIKNSFKISFDEEKKMITESLRKMKQKK